MSARYADFNGWMIRDLRAHEGKSSDGPFKGRDLLILTTRGAKSDEARETPLAFSLDGDRIVIVASKGGAPTNPAWFHNLQRHPEVTVEMHGERFPARATMVDGDEYERLYRQHADLMPTFHTYRERTSRKIPVIVLERLERAGRG